MRRLLVAGALAAAAFPVPASATPACVGAYTSGTGIVDRGVRQCVPHGGAVRCFDVWVHLPTGGEAVVFVCHPVLNPAY